MPRYVRYVGLAHQRQITASDWARAGMPNGQTVVWEAFNGFAVPLDQFTEEQIKKAIEPDQNFVITGDEDEAFEPDLTARHAMTPDQFEHRSPGILDGDRDENVSATGSEPSMAAPAGRGGTGAGTAGHDES